ncbi:MAG TPA: hypothetical protein PKK40_08815 [Marmoricola sp.]|nr:hypothetical protein [Marmoricola sp.]
MTYTTRKRDAYKVALTAVTGITTVAAMGGTGWLAGRAAVDYADQQAAKKESQARAQETWWRNHPPAPVVKIKTVWKKRKTITVVDAAPVTTYTYSYSAPSGGGGGGGSTTHSNPKPPKPPSAPTSGS